MMAYYESIMLLLRSLIIFIVVKNSNAYDPKTAPSITPALSDPKPIAIAEPAIGMTAVGMDSVPTGFARPMAIPEPMIDMPSDSMSPMYVRTMPMLEPISISEPMSGMEPQSMPPGPPMYYPSYPGPMPMEQENCAIISEMNTCCNAETQFIPDSLIKNCAESHAMPGYHPGPMNTGTVSSSEPIYMQEPGSGYGPHGPHMRPYQGEMRPSVEPQDSAFPLKRPIDSIENGDSVDDSSPTTIRKSKMPLSSFSSEVPKPNFARPKNLPPMRGMSSSVGSSDPNNLGSVDGMAVQSSGSPIYQRRNQFDGKNSNNEKSTEYMKKGAHMSRAEFGIQPAPVMTYDGSTNGRPNSREPLRTNDPCAMECAFRKSDFIDANNSLNITKITESFVEKAAEPWKSTVKSIISKCYANLTDFNSKPAPMPPCNGSAMMFMSCFTKNLYLECPTTQQISDKDPTCPKKTEQLKSCEPFQVPSPPPMMYAYGMPPPMPMDTRIRPMSAMATNGEPVPQIAVESDGFMQPEMAATMGHPKNKIGSKGPGPAMRKPNERNEMSESSGMSGGGMAGSVAGGIAGGVVGGMVASQINKPSDKPSGMPIGSYQNKRMPDSPIMTAIASPTIEETSDDDDDDDKPAGAAKPSGAAKSPMSPNGPKSMKTKTVQRNKSEVKGNSASKKQVDKSAGKKSENNNLNKKNGKGASANQKKQIDSAKNKHNTKTGAKDVANKGDKKTHTNKKNEKNVKSQGKSTVQDPIKKKDSVGKKALKRQGS